MNMNWGILWGGAASDQSRKTFVVVGKVQNVDGSIPANVEIRVVDVDLRSEQPLGSCSISAKDGSYRVSYTSGQFKRAEKGSADLKVYAYNTCNDSNVPIAVSAIHFNVGDEVTIDIVVGGDTVRGPSEFKRLSDEIFLLLRGSDVEIADLLEDDDHKDFTFISGETGEAMESIAFLTLAYKYHKQTAIAADVFYGLFIEKISSDLNSLAADTPESLQTALEAAIDDNVIDQRDDASVAAALQSLQTLSSQLAIKMPDSTAETPLSSLLKTTIPDPAPFVDQLAKFDGNPDTFWKAVQDDPALKDKVGSLQLTVQLGIVTGLHQPLINELQKAQNVSQFSDLARLSQVDWLKIVQMPDVGVPDSIPGASLTEKANNYSIAMANLIEDTFPTNFITNRLADTDDTKLYGPMKNKPEILQFLQNNSTFDLVGTRVSDYVLANPDALKGQKSPDDLILQISAVQRVYSIAPRYTQMRALMAGNIISAMQISRMGRGAFVNSFAAKIGGMSQALTIFEIAQQNHATAMSLWTTFGSKFLPPWRIPGLGPPWFSPSSVQKAIPDWETLFGSADSCSCDECNSITGASAYYVDILHFLKDRRIIDNAKTIRDGDGNITSVQWQQILLPDFELVDKTAKDVLFERRPDLGAIQLTCENTNTPVPYIDLTLEILENYISPQPPFFTFSLPASALDPLNNNNVQAISNLFNPPLSEFAVISNITSGVSWAIDETAYTYFISKLDTMITVDSRGLQTRGMASDLAAYPQYINSAAYDLLQSEVCPFDLPFNLWVESIRTYLAHVVVKRTDIMEAFSTSSRTQTLSDPSIVLESLGLITAEAYIILNYKDQTKSPIADVWKLYGFDKANLDESSSIPDPADSLSPIKTGDWISVLTGRLDVFLQQTRLSYRELLNVVEISSIFDVELPLKIQAQFGQPPDTCDLSKLTLLYATQENLLSIMRLIRLLRKLGGWTLLDLVSSVQSMNQALRDSTSMQNVLLQISCIQRLTRSLGLPIEVIAAFWKPVNVTSYKNYVDDDEDDTPAPGSQYERIFRNKAINMRQDQSLPRDASKLSGKLSASVSIITACLNITVSDLTLILNTPAIVSDDVLSLKNLSKLFRHISMMKALGLETSDYLIVIQLFDSDPFANAVGTVIFVEKVQRLLNSPFALTQINYILRNYVPGDMDIGMTDISVAVVLDDLRDNLQQIATDQTYSDSINDSKGDLTRQKLALLNWDAAVITAVVGMLNNAVSFEIALPGPLATGLVLPTSLQDSLSYDGSTLFFSRIMTDAERDLLLALPNANDAFRTAVSTLYTLPRTYFQRNTHSFSVPSYSASLTAIPAGTSIPTTLAKKVYWNSATSMIYSLGALTDIELQALLEGVTDATYLAAINQLFQAPSTHVVLPSDQFLDAGDINFLLDMTNGASVASRCLRILAKLMPYLLQTLGNQTINQKLSQAFGLASQIMGPMLTEWIQIGAAPVNNIFREVDYAASHKLVQISAARFPLQFQAFRLLEKVAMIISGFKIGVTELSWLFIYRHLANDPTAAWLNLNALPLVFSSTTLADLTGWEHLVTLFEVRDSLPKGADVLDGIFAASRSSETSANIESQILTLLDAATNWDIEALAFLVGPGGFNLQLPSAFQDEVAISRLLQAMKLSAKIGCSASDAISFTRPNVTVQEARTARQAVKSKYDQDTWNTVARPLQNILRDKQRAALVSYILAHPSRNQRQTWRNSNDVYAYLLIDVEQGPCAFTSRIKQAIGSVQTFTQNCLLNLETEVEANSEVDDAWDEWYLYLKSFRLTSANREILCYPENYMVPSLRDDKSPFFQDLESQLQQNPVTTDSIELAIMNYIENVDIVARLQIISHYHQTEGIEGGISAVDTLHVFARTRSSPYKYFYATRQNGSTWTPWTALTVDVSGESLIPVVWNRRLHLFWATFTLRQDTQTSITVPPPNGTIPASPTYVDVQLAWSELRVGKWTAKTLSDQMLTLNKSGTSLEWTSDEDFMNWYTFRTNIDANNVLHILLQTEISNNVTQGEFVIEDVKSGVSVNTNYNIGTFRVPRKTKENQMCFQGTYRINQTAKVWLPNTVDDSLVLANVPNHRFQVVFAPQWYDPNVESPFFFQHDQMTFFVEYVEPRWITTPRQQLSVPNDVHPGLLQGGLLDQYLELPQAPSIRQFSPPPLDAGPTRFLSSGEILNNSGAPSYPSPTSTLRNATTPITTDFPSTSVRSFGDIIIPIGTIRIPPRFKFTTFYHPFVTEFMRHLNRDGLDGLFQRPVQLSRNIFFESTYAPVTSVVSPAEFPVETVDFHSINMYSLYNWELFFHLPLTIADQLSTNQQFKDAQSWYHYIFDPTDTSSLSPPQKFWRMGLLFNTNSQQYIDQTLPNILKYLAKAGSGITLSADEQAVVQNTQETIRQWRKNPFDPYLIARGRTTAFQKMVVMKYLDNLIAWGDQLFAQDTIETINEATQLYILASAILGERPAEIPSRAVPTVQTFNTIAQSLDSLSNSLVRIEEMVSVGNLRTNFIIPTKTFPHVAPPTMLYFCVPNNPKLLRYWDTVADRLFKIRNCMNLQGIVRELALFEPPIDPALLVRAAASGVDLSSALSDINVSLSQYRYGTLAAKAVELVSYVKELGKSFLDALEKKDASTMALLQSQNELDLLNAMTAVKSQAVDEANAAITSLNKGRLIAQARYDHYFNKELMNAWEFTHTVLETASTVLELAESGAQPVSAVLHIIPDAKLGAPTSIGITFGGPALGESASKFGDFMGKLASLVKHTSAMTGELGSFYQRKDDWDLQADLASKELDQIDAQIAGATARAGIASKELDNHKLQYANSQKVNDLMRSKFTSTDLYDWSISQIASIYFQGYQMAYNAAKSAERAYATELSIDDSNFIQFGSWDGLKKGLLAGERLHQQLLQLESAYLLQNRREYEINQSISLAQIDPVALLELQSTGKCSFKFAEAVFDVNYPSHYMRRIKTVAITIPSVVGPYTSVNCTLSLLKSTVRIVPTLSRNKYSRVNNDPRFRDNYEQFDSICTSTGVNDYGLFELNLRDDRYLPFEYAGAISSWSLTMPKIFRQFNYNSISDVIFHVRYTAREGGEELQLAVETELQAKILEAVQMAEGQTGMGKLFQLRRDFPEAFYKLTRPPTANAPQQISVKLTPSHLPYMFVAAKSITLNKMAIFVRVQLGYKQAVNAGNLHLSLVPNGVAVGNGVNLSDDGNGLLRATIDIGHAWGELTLTVWMDGDTQVPADAFEDIMMVGYYSAQW